MGTLSGKVALVAGGTRGAGRGIAVELGAAGAHVYVTGRTTRGQQSEYGRPETIEETAELVTAAGGRGTAVAVDHLEPAQVAGPGGAHRARDRPARRAGQRHLGRRAAVRLDGEALGARPGQRPATAPAGRRDAPDHQPLRAAAADPPPGRAGGGDDRRHGGVQRGEPPGVRVLRPGQVGGAAAGLEPGSRAGRVRVHRGRPDPGLDALGDDARALRRHRGHLARGAGPPGAAAVPDPGHFGISETPRFTGRAVAALAADPDVARWNQASLSSGQLAKEYGFTDLDGSSPDAWRYIVEVQDAGKPADTTGYR